MGSAFDSTRGARSSSPFASATPVARPFTVMMRSTSASVRISAPASRAASAITSRQPAHAAADEPPRARPAPGLLARVIVQQHERGPRRRRAGDAVVDRVPAERGHHVLGLEPLRQELRRRRREQERQVRRGRVRCRSAMRPARASSRRSCALRTPRVRRASARSTARPHRRTGRDPPRTARARRRRGARTAASPRASGPCRRRGSSARRRGRR